MKKIKDESSRQDVLYRWKTSARRVQKPPEETLCKFDHILKSAKFTVKGTKIKLKSSTHRSIDSSCGNISPVTFKYFGVMILFAYEIRISVL